MALVPEPVFPEGYFNDPPAVQGLAHFCEHMLFLGTEQFPEESSALVFGSLPVPRASELLLLPCLSSLDEVSIPI